MGAAEKLETIHVGDNESPFSDRKYRTEYGYTFADPVNLTDPNGKSALVALLVPVAVFEVAFDATTLLYEKFVNKRTWGDAKSIMFVRSPTANLGSTGIDAVYGSFGTAFQVLLDPTTFDTLMTVLKRQKELNKCEPRQ